MMLKVIPPGSQRFDEPIAQLVKVSSRGLIGNDYQQFVKRAGDRIADAFRNLEFAPGEVPLHLIAVGSTEKFGANRNGDGFEEDVCDKYHDTFRKHARVYQNHKNKNPAKSYGVVKYSTFHRPMSRIELIVALNGDEKTAKANGGLRAESALEKLARGQDLAVSMACRVPFDICSFCGNKARNRDEYCDESMCKAGGLKNNMGAVLSDGHILHARNTLPTFFDISEVFRPADRIAYASGILEKAASGALVSGAALAEQLQLTLPYNLRELSRSSIADAIKLAYALADIEDAVDTVPAGLPPADAELSKPDGYQPHKLAHALRALVDEQIVLPPREFFRLATGFDNEKVAVAAAAVERTPNLFNDLISAANVEQLIADNPYTPAPSCAAPLRVWAYKHAADFSLAVNHMTQRARLAAIRNAPAPAFNKSASYTAAAQPLVREYALYKLAACVELPGATTERERAFRLAVLQNYFATC